MISYLHAGFECSVHLCSDGNNLSNPVKKSKTSEHANMQLYKGLNLPLCVLPEVVKSISLISLCLPHCTENSLKKSEFFTVFSLTLLFTSQIWSVKLQPLRDLHDLNGNIPCLCCVCTMAGVLQVHPEILAFAQKHILHQITEYIQLQKHQIYSSRTSGTQLHADEEIIPGQKVLLHIFKGPGKSSRSKSWPRAGQLVSSVLTPSLWKLLFPIYIHKISKQNFFSII